MLASRGVQGREVETDITNLILQKDCWETEGVIQLPKLLITPLTVRQISRSCISEIERHKMHDLATKAY